VSFRSGRSEGKNRESRVKREQPRYCERRRILKKKPRPEESGGKAKRMRMTREPGDLPVHDDVPIILGTTFAGRFGLLYKELPCFLPKASEKVGFLH